MDPRDPRVKGEGHAGAAKVHAQVIAECHMHVSEASKVLRKLDETIDVGEIEKLSQSGSLVKAYKETFPYDPKYIRELLGACMEGTKVVERMKATYGVLIIFFYSLFIKLIICGHYILYEDIQ